MWMDTSPSDILLRKKKWTFVQEANENVAMNVQAAIVRVHINDDDRVTSCVKCELANQRQRVKKLKCAPRKSGSCGTFGNERQTRNASGRKLLGHGITSPGRGCTHSVPLFCSPPSRKRRTSPAGSAAHKALHINEAVTFLRLATFFVINCHRPVPVASSSRPTAQHHTSRPSHTSASILRRGTTVQGPG